MAPGPASEMVVDVSKFLYFAATQLSDYEPKENPSNLMDADNYLDKPTEDGIESSGQLSKLSRIEEAFHFALSHYKWQGGVKDKTEYFLHGKKC